MFRVTPVYRIGTISTVLGNLVLFTASRASLTDPFGILFLGGLIFRALSLPLSIYGDRCLARSACALPELQEAHQQYKEIVDHPRAILWEKKVAAQKLKNDRERIFRSHHTDNVRMVVPHVAALGVTWYGLCIPAQQLHDYLTMMSASTTATVISPLVFHFAGMIMDPTLPLAATLTLFSTHQHLQRRKGFNDRLDGWIRQANLYVFTSWGVFLMAALVLQPTGFFPPHLAPVWLGVASLSVCKSILVNHTAPMRSLFKIPNYPATHGMYGTSSTAEGHEYRLAFIGVDAEERRNMWQTQKKALDYECNVRLHRMLKLAGLFDRIEEAEHEAMKLQKKIDVVRDRRRERELKEKGEIFGEINSEMTATILPGDIVGPSAETVAAAHFDDMQTRENERRRQRRSVTESHQN